MSLNGYLLTPWHNKELLLVVIKVWFLTIQYGINTADHQWNSPKIGDKVTLSGGTSGRDHVIVVATFTNGVKQVTMDTYV